MGAGATKRLTFKPEIFRRGGNFGLENGSYEFEGTFIIRGDEYPTNFTITFENGVIGGEGSDINGAFTWNGTISNNRDFKMQKYYSGLTPFLHEGSFEEGGNKMVGLYKHAKLAEKFEFRRKREEEEHTKDPLELTEHDKKAKQLATLLKPIAGEGIWVGYYEQMNNKHDMTFTLSVAKDGNVLGRGSDGIGEFSWEGNINENNDVSLKKTIHWETFRYVYWKIGRKNHNRTISSVWTKRGILAH